MSILAVTCVKNEAPYLLEWLSHHRALGIDHFLVFSNDCEDGTDVMLDEVARAGWLTHLRHTQQGKKTIQWQALRTAYGHPDYTAAEWVLFFDVDEFIALDPSVPDLKALLDRDMDAMILPWRLFGNGGQGAFADAPVTERFTTAATRTIPVPLGHFFKTIYRRSVFGEMGVHRPKSLANGTARWADAAGDPLPDAIAQSPNRINSFGHVPAKPLVQLNHYSLRSVAEYVLKTRRGLPNKMHLDLGLKYWVSRNWNTIEDWAISHHAPATRAMQAEIETEALRDLHQKAVAWHQERFADAMTDPEVVDLYWQLQLAGSSHEPDADTARSYFTFLQAVRRQEGA